MASTLSVGADTEGAEYFSEFEPGQVVTCTVTGVVKSNDQNEIQIEVNKVDSEIEDEYEDEGDGEEMDHEMGEGPMMGGEKGEPRGGKHPIAIIAIGGKR